MGMTPKDLVPVPRWKEELAILGVVLLVLAFLVAYGIAWSLRSAWRGPYTRAAKYLSPEPESHPEIS